MISYGEERINMSLTEKLAIDGGVESDLALLKDLAVDPEIRAKQQAQELIDHFNEFVDGTNDSFAVIFINSEAQHVRQHRHFHNELNLRPEASSDTGEPSDVVLRVGNVTLKQAIEIGADRAPYGVSYRAVRQEV